MFFKGMPTGVKWVMGLLIAITIFAFAMAFMMVKNAHAMDPAELRNVDPNIRAWFETMKSPDGKLCCSYADGHRTEYEHKLGHYWVPIKGKMVLVPKNVVITDRGNPFSEGVVWYHPIFENGLPTGEYKILCFVPADRT